jgi:hypothetical protein
VSSALIDPLRPKPFRGDVVAAGVVVLATLVWVVRVRFIGAWGNDVQLAWATVPWCFVTMVAILSPMERAEPRAYQSVLYVASVALAIAVVVAFSDALGADYAFSSPGVTTSSMAALAVLAFAFAVLRNSAVCTLLGSLLGGTAVIAGYAWAFASEPFASYRWVLLGLMVAFAVAAIGQRDRRPRHGVALIDAAGLAVLLIGMSFLPSLTLLIGIEPSLPDNSDPFLAPTYSFGLGGFRVAGSVGWGWELLILAAGFGLVAYASVDRQPGPAYFGVANLIVFAVITSFGVAAGGATLVGWPIALAVAAVALLAIGLRPTTPAPPPPNIDAPEPPPLPLR